MTADTRTGKNGFDPMAYTAIYYPCNHETPATIIGTFWTRNDAVTACASHFHREHAETRNTQDLDTYAAYPFDRGQLCKWNDNDPVTVIGANGRFHQYTITPKGD